MQTFLPLPNFEMSARILDDKRLGKQRVEAYQILAILTEIELIKLQPKVTAPRIVKVDESYLPSYRNHPAVKMWVGYERALMWYGREICNEWIIRGFRDSLLAEFQDTSTGPITLPFWLGFEPFHSSHRAALLSKNPGFYSRYGWIETPGINYVWPHYLKGTIHEHR